MSAIFRVFSVAFVIVVLALTSGGVRGDSSDGGGSSGGGPAAPIPIAPPGQLAGLVMAYDSASGDCPGSPSAGCVILFGGHNGNTLDSGTFYYETSSAGWKTPTISSSPSARAWAGMAYDAADGYILLYGGCTTLLSTSTGVCSGDSGDAYKWSWNSGTSTGTWTSVCTSCTAPAVFGAVMVYDSNKADCGSGATTGCVLLSSGCTTVSSTTGVCSAYAGSIYKWAGTTWSAICSSSCGTPSQWGGGSTYDSADSYVLLYGGCTAQSSSTGFCTTATSQAYKMASASWSSLSCSPCGASARYDDTIAMDITDNYVVLFSGFDSSTTNTVQTSLIDGYTWNGASKSWSAVCGTSGLNRCPLYARGGAGEAEDPVSHGVLLYGGGYTTGDSMDGTWLFKGGGWSAPLWPSARSDMGAAIDPTDGYIVMFGGETASGGLLGDVWGFYGTSGQIGSTFSSLCTSSCGATARYDMAIAKDPNSGDCGSMSNGCAFMFGGTDSTGHLSDTYYWTGSTWHQLCSGATACGVSARTGASMAYDPESGTMILFGGCCSSFGKTLGDTYYWSSSQSKWLVTCTSSCTYPAALELVGTTTDTTTSDCPSTSYGCVLTYGGLGVSPTLYSTKTQIEQNYAWSLPCTSSCGPSGRYADAVSLGIFYVGTVFYTEPSLFGGYDGTNELQDSWYWNSGSWHSVSISIPPSARSHMAYTPDSSVEPWFAGGATSTSSVVMDAYFLHAPSGGNWAWEPPLY